MTELVINKGDFVRIAEHGGGDLFHDRYGYRIATLEAGTQYEVVQVTKSKVRVTNADTYGDLWIPKDKLEGSAAPLGPLEKHRPEDYIDPLDPRVAWIWDATAEFAKQKGYCSVYDEIMSGLGLPGRPKNFTVDIDLGLASATSRITISARSKEEAREIARKQLVAAGSNAKVVGANED